MSTALTLERLANTNLADLEKNREPMLRAAVIKAVEGELTAGELFENLTLFGMTKGEWDALVARARERFEAHRDMEALGAEQAEMDTLAGELEKLRKWFADECYKLQAQRDSVGTSFNLQSQAIEDQRRLLSQSIGGRRQRTAVLRSKMPERLREEIGTVQRRQWEAEAKAGELRIAIHRASLGQPAEQLAAMEFRISNLEQCRQEVPQQLTLDVRTAKQLVARIGALTAEREQAICTAAESKAEAERLSATAMDWKCFDVS